MNIAALVILYHPKEHYLKNVRQLQEKVDGLYIADNTEKPSACFENYILDVKKAAYLHDGKNQGISERLNQVCTLAKKNGYSWLLTMDQDSLFDDRMLDNYLKCVEDFEGKEEVVCLGYLSQKRYITREIADRFRFII